MSHLLPDPKKKQGGWGVLCSQAAAPNRANGAGEGLEMRVSHMSVRAFRGPGFHVFCFFAFDPQKGSGVGLAQHS